MGKDYLTGGFYDDDDIRNYQIGRLIGYFLGIIIGCFLWPYILHTVALWLGKTIFVAWWQGGLLSIIPLFGKNSIIIAIFVWIFSIFIL